MALIKDHSTCGRYPPWPRFTVCSTKKAGQSWCQNILVSSIRTPMLIQGRLKRTDTNLMNLKWQLTSTHGKYNLKHLKDIPAQWARIRQGLDIFRISSKCVCLSNGEVWENLTVPFFAIKFYRWEKMHGLLWQLRKMALKLLNYDW